MESRKRSKNLMALLFEIILTISICLGITYNSYIEISTQANNFAVEVDKDYRTLTNDYIRSFQVLRMEAEEKIEEDLSFEEMQSWLQSKDKAYTDAIGGNVYDGFAFTYKGGYVHSWNYGDYSEYVPSERPWYQTAQKADGAVAVVAPYVTFLSNTDLIENYDILRMSIVQKYNEEISFDFDLNVSEINALLADRSTMYSGTTSVLFDKDGYILSSTNEKMYGHNVNVPDDEISEELSQVLRENQEQTEGMSISFVDGKIKMVYRSTDVENQTLCMMIPFMEVFEKNFLFVICLALLLLSIEIIFYFQNKKHLNYLEEANRTKTDFLSRMSHELRTPLNAVRGYTAIIRDGIVAEQEVKQEEKKEQLQTLTYMDRASEYLLRIIDDILDVQNSEFGKTHIKKEIVDAESYLNNIVDIVTREAKEKGITFSVTCNSSLKQEYLMDGVRFQQILLNVLHNAIKFTPEGGTVKMTVETIAEDDNTSTIQFVVSDTGIGMSQKFIEQKLFTNFAQENQSVDSPYEGCGIGMAISKKLLDLMDGQIRCQSEKGKGSIFTITITVERVKEKRRRRDHSQHIEYDLNGIRVLLCEDNPMNQDMERCVLERMKCVVEIAEDGQIGLDKYIQSVNDYYSIILMDIRMPNLDGWETTRRIRALDREDAKRIPILAVSANVFEDDKRKSMEAGIDEHLAKPVDAKILYEKITQYCRKSE